MFIRLFLNMLVVKLDKQCDEVCWGGMVFLNKNLWYLRELQYRPKDFVNEAFGVIDYWVLYIL